MSIQEARRAAFVDAFIKKFGFGPMAASSNAEAQQMLEAAEWAWNAALDSVMVELPSASNAHNNEVIKAVGRYIWAQGIRVEVKS